ncbi:phosphoglycolate phosphatase [uncultured Sulfitobacter sp.]|uniref:phosphoglycolate phosphatase n=1 Tax=uncultured Sulfitobacter sp. TaxID=191468 RepID=UPI00260B4ECC|nr:phosphoglycolate phosphatase [uncultured Sulfitobacter sp.]
MSNTVGVRIVFDLDGTLIDSAPDICAVANALLAPHHAQITLAQTHMFIGNGVSVFVARMLAAVGLSETLHAEVLAGFKAAYPTAVGQTHPYAGVIHALGILKRQGHMLGICTNKPLVPCMAVLDHLGLTDYFDTFWGGDSLAVHKPDPAPLRAAFDALGQGPSVYVGDSEVDAQTAQAAEVPFLLFSAGYRKSPLAQIPHSAAFDDFATLPALVTQYAE